VVVETGLINAAGHGRIHRPTPTPMKRPVRIGHTGGVFDFVSTVQTAYCSFLSVFTGYSLSVYLNVTTLRSGICYRKSVCLSFCNVRAPYSAG